MTRLQALKELARKVEDGESYATMGHTLLCQKAFPKPDDFDGTREAYAKLDAQMAILAWSNGSLDAAKALHEALLPGWHFDIDSEAGGVCVFKSALDSAELGKCECLARAWLLAILRALIAQEEGE